MFLNNFSWGSLCNSWIVDPCGATQGPISEDSLIRLYLDETIHSKTYVWNGESVKQWIPIMNVKYIYEKIRHHCVHQHKSGSPGQSPLADESRKKLKPKEQERSTSLHNEYPRESRSKRRKRTVGTTSNRASQTSATQTDSATIHSLQDELARVQRAKDADAQQHELQIDECKAQIEALQVCVCICAVRPYCIHYHIAREREFDGGTEREPAGAGGVEKTN